MGESKRKQAFNETARNALKVVCPECRKPTRHIVLKSVDLSGSERMDKFNDYDWSDHFQIIQCQGCEAVSFRQISSNTEDFEMNDDDELEYVEREALYPPRIAGRAELGDADFLPFHVHRIYRETVNALANAQPILCGIGIGALIEAVCDEQQATGATLKDKIDALVKLQILSLRDAEFLHKLRFLRNQAAHKAKPHKQSQLVLAMDIIERLLQGVYILEARAKGSFK
ncbi:MAG: DUF4145 domain-containing protein [Betaproteobacteria bacterium]|nr:MAG: DUF4145 domain-containing protein [Betaproteobacteria bacterium]